MVQRARHTQTPGRQAVGYTDRAYWNGLIKMSLSKRGRAAFQVAVEAWMEVTQCLVQSECVMVESTACSG